MCTRRERSEVSKLNWSSILSSLPGLIATLASAGPWGIAAMVLGGGALAYVFGVFIKNMNKKVDAADMARAGADAGETAKDLKNQADGNRDWIRQKLEEQRKEGPKELD